ncbi:MAG: peptidoglycan-binding protein, partial [Alphaproteobacteria bacterium]|nr:peptidoglycan-binding protein [Alphaproteobacteria bacterium]
MALRITNLTEYGTNVMTLYDNFLSGLEPIKKKNHNFSGDYNLNFPVGDKGTNSEYDVEKIERSLGENGYLDPIRASKPTGKYDSGLKSAIMNYQEQAGLKKDGVLNPSGPTITALAEKRAANIVPSRRVDTLTFGATNRLARGMTESRNHDNVSRFVADAALNYGVAGKAEVSHLMRQLADDAPETAVRFHKSLSKRIPDNLHRALYARAMSDDEGDSTPDVPDGPDTPDEP